MAVLVPVSASNSRNDNSRFLPTQDSMAPRCYPWRSSGISLWQIRLIKMLKDITWDCPIVLID